MRAVASLPLSAVARLFRTDSGKIEAACQALLTFGLDDPFCQEVSPCAVVLLV